MQNDEVLEQTLVINGTEYYLQRDNATDSTWWATEIIDGELNQMMGEHLFTIDLKKVYNLFQDYPKALTREEKETFDRENPFWQEYFSDRK